MSSRGESTERATRLFCVDVERGVPLIHEKDFDRDPFADGRVSEVTRERVFPDN